MLPESPLNWVGSPKGIATATKDVALIKARLKQAREDFETRIKTK